jgi:hypothetical protein
MMGFLGGTTELRTYAIVARVVGDCAAGGVAIGGVIYWDARILIMDEPTVALGVPHQRGYRADLESAHMGAGRTG